MTPSARRAAAAASCAVLLAAALSACTGASPPTPTPPASSNPWAVAVGDCIDDGDITGTVSRVRVVDCATTHDAEAYFRLVLRDGAFPGATAVRGAARAGCVTAFADFVGIPYADSTALDISWYFPTRASWAGLHDRAILCKVFAVDATGAPQRTAGTLRGARR